VNDATALATPQENRVRRLALDGSLRAKREITAGGGGGGGRPDKKIIIPVVVGTRPEAIKLVPVILALRDSARFEPLVVSTGQHNRMVSYIFELVGITPDVQLWSGGRHAHLNARLASIVERLDDFLTERFDLTGDRAPTMEEIESGRAPGAILVHGDTSSAMAAAMSAFHLRIPVMHVEAGLRTGTNNSPFPEELNRQVITRIAALHFAPTATNLQNLVRESVPADQIFVTGNTGIDTLQWAATLDMQFANRELQDLYDSDARIVVVTAHRRENWGDGLAGIAEGIIRIARAAPHVHFVLPVHPNPNVQQVLSEHLSGLDNVLLTDPLGYATFAKLLARASFVMTDSGGVQEEAPSLGKPVLVLRNTTERNEGVDAGTLRLVGTNPDLIYAEGMRLIEDPIAYAEMSAASNPYGDGRAAERIVDAIGHVILGTEAPRPFGPGYSRSAIARAAGLDFATDPAADVTHLPTAAARAAG
jgi:UDP-N-acetylglucosamine 2-epimerase (non-hydrolysing)